MDLYTWKCITSAGAPYHHNDVNKIKGTRIGWKMKNEIYHTVNRLQRLLSSCHPVIWSFDHSVIWSRGHAVTQSLGHLVTQSLGHSVNRSQVIILLFSIVATH